MFPTHAGLLSPGEVRGCNRPFCGCWLKTKAFAIGERSTWVMTHARLRDVGFPAS